jgi:hypothetical protein
LKQSKNREVLTWVEGFTDGVTTGEIRKEFPTADIRRMEEQGLLWYNVAENCWYSLAAKLREQDGE